MDTYKNPKSGKTYISRRLDSFHDPSRKVRIATKLIDQPTTYAFAQLKDEVVLRHKEDAKSCITAKFFEDDRGVFVLSIQAYTVATNKPHSTGFSFIGDEIGTLVEFLNQIRSVPLKSGAALTIKDDDLRRLVLSPEQAQLLLRDNHEIFAEVLRSAITKADIVAVGYRKQQWRYSGDCYTMTPIFATCKRGSDVRRRRCGRSSSNKTPGYLAMA
jgi:hypothetical protein